MSPGASGAAGPAGPSISVVVVNWNGGRLLQDCLRSLVADAGGRLGSGVEIVLVDNASADGSADQAERAFEHLRVVRRPTNEGFAAGANAGIGASTGEFVVLVNNDARVEPGFLSSITAPMAEPGADFVGAVTGRVVLAGRFRQAPATAAPEHVLVAADGRRWTRVGEGEPGVRLLNSTGGLMTTSGNGRDRDWLAPADAPPAPADVFAFNGGCAALRRRALVEVGDLDQRLFMYYEDTELSWRLRRAGWRVRHAHEAVTEHQHAASSGTATEFFQVHNTRNRLVVAAAHAPWRVFVRALARTCWRLAAGPHRGRTARAMAQTVAMLAGAVATRRAVDRTARCSRRDVAGWLVAD